MCEMSLGKFEAISVRFLDFTRETGPCLRKVSILEGFVAALLGVGCIVSCLNISGCCSSFCLATLF